MDHYATATEPTPTRPVLRLDPAKREKIPHTAHFRELEMPDGRKLLLDRRSIAFLCQGKPEEFAGKQVTIVGFKTMARACPVAAGYVDLKAWWRDDNAANGKGEQVGPVVT